jgi:hypothetical protein
MPARVRVGQVWCVGATIILLSILPWRPASLGVPYARIHETGAVWIAYAFLLWGMGRARSSIGSLAGDVAHAKRLKAGLNAASGAMCLTALTTLVSLTSILATTLEGARFISLPFGRAELYPSELNYALAAPLTLALVCHAGLVAMQIPANSASAWPVTASTVRTLLLAVLGLMLAVFLLMALGSLADRRFVVGAVAATWIASWTFLGSAIEHLTWSTTLPLPGEAPFAPRP